MTKTEEAFTARFGGQVLYAMPDGRCVYEYRGRDYLLEGAMADPEAIMPVSYTHLTLPTNREV